MSFGGGSIHAGDCLFTSVYSTFVGNHKHWRRYPPGAGGNIWPNCGELPGVNAVTTYTTLLGVPLVFMRLFDIGHQMQMSLVLIWVNLLVLAVPIFMVLIFRRIRNTKNWLWSVLVVIPTLMVSGSWSAASSNTESLSMIPGRTLLPVMLGYFLVRAAKPNTKIDNVLTTILVGIFSIAVAMNNIEFGVPALGSMVLVYVILAFHLQRTSRHVLFLIVGMTGVFCFTSDFHYQSRALMIWTSESALMQGNRILQLNYFQFSVCTMCCSRFLVRQSFQQ